MRRRHRGGMKAGFGAGGNEKVTAVCSGGEDEDENDGELRGASGVRAVDRRFRMRTKGFLMPVCCCPHESGVAAMATVSTSARLAKVNGPDLETVRRQEVCPVNQDILVGNSGAHGVTRPTYRGLARQRIDAVIVGWSYARCRQKPPFHCRCGTV